ASRYSARNASICTKLLTAGTSANRTCPHRYGKPGGNRVGAWGNVALRRRPVLPCPALLGGPSANVSSCVRRPRLGGVLPSQWPDRDWPRRSILPGEGRVDAPCRAARGEPDQRKGRRARAAAGAADRRRLRKRGPGRPRGREAVRRPERRGGGRPSYVERVHRGRPGVRRWGDAGSDDLTGGIEPRALRDESLRLS